MQPKVKIGVTVEEEFAPDVIEVRIHLGNELPARDACTAEYNIARRAVVAALAEAGIPESELKDSSFTVREHRESLYDKTEWGHYRVVKTMPLGFEYRASMQLTRAATTEEMQRVWRALVDAGDNVQFSIDFALADEKAAEDSLLAKAVAEGKRKAEVLAAAAGAKLAGIEELLYDFEPESHRNYYGLEAPCAAPGLLTTASPPSTPPTSP